MMEMSGAEPRYPIEPQNDIALIINNQRFTTKGKTCKGVNLVERRGSDTDVTMLEGAMKEFGYDVRKFEDLEAAKILEAVKKIAKEINDNSSSFVCFILTHGDKGNIYGSDSESIDLNEVTDVFKEANCPCLAGKPKLFFIHASGVHHDVDYDYLNDCEFRRRMDPAEPHFLIAISLAPENVSFKSEKDGTWVISELVEIFTNYCKYQDVTSMLLKVNKNASRAHAEKGYKQPCQLVFTTTKIVKFPSTAGSDVPMMSQLAIGEKDLKSDEAEKQNEKGQPHHDDKYWCYPMEKQYGVAVIINVQRFQGLSNRTGSGNDVAKLQQLWDNLGFTVKDTGSVNLTGRNIFTFLQQVAKEVNEKQNSSCFVCCIMTHGKMGKLYGSDDDSVDIKAIIDLFKESNCPALAGKPKLFFIQACRGPQRSNLKEPKALTTHGVTNGIVNTLDASTSATSDGRENSEFVGQANPHEIDFLIGYSTLPGETSNRHEEYGTWYIRALVEIFQEYHKDEDVLSMMTRVNSKLAEHEHFEQCPAPVLTLTRKIYL